MMTLTKEDLAAIEGLFTGKFNEMNDQFGRIDEKFGRIDEQFERIDEQFERIDKKFERIDEQFERIDKRLDGIDERLDGIDERLDGLEGRMDKLEGTVADMNLRLEHVESDVSSLKIGQLELSCKLSEVSAKVDATYDLALENWGQIEESKVRLNLLEN